MPITQICIDMDGVLFDWVGGVCKLFGTSMETLVSTGQWKAGEYETRTALNCTESEIWERIDKIGMRFWSDLAPYDWHHELLKLCRSYAPTIILSSPSRAPSSLHGKICCLQRHFGGHAFRDFLIGPKKEFCARPGAVLIDDYDVNCEKFIKHGGNAIVFPRHWNSAHELAGNPMAYVRTCLEGHANGWTGAV